MTVTRAACLAPLTLLALLAGCAGPGSPEQTTASRELHGHLVLGPQYSAFRPCGQSETLWLQAAAPLAAQLDATYLEQTGGPYEEAYLRLRGRPQASTEDCLPCREHAATLQLEQLLELRAAAAGDCR